MPESIRIGWVGTGVMGLSMCRHLIDAGYPVTAFNRTKSKAAALVEAGASWAGSPREVAEQSDIVFAIVGFPRDVREVFLGEPGALVGCRPGMILVDMSTSEPSLAREIAARALEKGVASL